MRISHLALLAVWIAFASLALPTPAADFDQEKLHNWHQWRGPMANGFAPFADPPLQWSADSNIKWKVEVPGQGESTPVVWNDRIFITTAIQTDRKEEQPPAEVAEAPGGNPFKIERPTNYYQFIVQCYDRAHGKLLWQKTVTEAVPHEGHHKDHGYASPSPITDGRHVWASFGSRGIYCFDMDGELKWQRDLGDLLIYRFFGEATSPVLDGDTLFVNWDHEGDSFLYALDATTGETRWQSQREPGTSWATPLVVDYKGRKQIVVNSNKKARGYDFVTGEVLWECGGQTLAIIPCPVSYHDKVFLMSGYPEAALFAVPLDSKGDISGTDKIAWSRTSDTPYCPSPVLIDAKLYFNKSNSAILTVLDAASGKPVIEKQRLPDIRNVYASPVAAHGRVYFTDRDGTTVVLDDGPELKVIATNKLDAQIDASPALVDKVMILRSTTHLYCIGE